MTPFAIGVALATSFTKYVYTESAFDRNENNTVKTVCNIKLKPKTRMYWTVQTFTKLHFDKP